MLIVLPAKIELRIGSIFSLNAPYPREYGELLWAGVLLGILKSSEEVIL